jgi:hypothetical protein
VVPRSHLVAAQMHATGSAKDKGAHRKGHTHINLKILPRSMDTRVGGGTRGGHRGATNDWKMGAGGGGGEGLEMFEEEN